MIGWELKFVSVLMGRQICGALTHASGLTRVKLVNTAARQMSKWKTNDNTTGCLTHGE